MPLNRQLNLHMLTMIVRSVFEENGKFYSHLYLDDGLYEFWKWFSTKKMMFQKELTLIKQVHPKKDMLCHYWYFKDVRFKFG